MHDHGRIPLQAKIFYSCKPKSYYVTPTRRCICKPLIRKSYRSFAVHSLRGNKRTRAAIVKEVGRELRQEVAAICSDTFKSVMRQKSKAAIKKFHHTSVTLMRELETKAPTLLSLLKSCMKTRKPRSNTGTVIAMIVSVICKNRRPSACQFQRVISLILYAGHCSKQASITINKRGNKIGNPPSNMIATWSLSLLASCIISNLVTCRTFYCMLTKLGLILDLVCYRYLRDCINWGFVYLTQGPLSW